MSTGKPSQDPAARARDQLGAFFLLLSLALACGPVIAADDLKEMFPAYNPWWCVSWALLFDLPALILVNVPWAMRTVFGVPAGSAVEDTKRALFLVLRFAVVLAAVDWVVLSVGEAGLWSATTVIGASGVAPLLLVPLALSRYQGKHLLGYVALLPMAWYFNALLVLSLGGFVVRPVVT